MISGTDSEKKQAFEQIRKDTNNSISCSEKGFASADLPQLTQILKEKSNVTELNLNFISIGFSGTENLKELILQVKGLKKLSLSITDIGNNGMLSLIFDSRLESVIRNIDFDFSTNGIDEEGLRKAMLAAEKKILSPSSLLSILGGNPIYDESLVSECIKLAKSLRKEKEFSLSKIEGNAGKNVNTSSNLFTQYEEEKEQDLPQDLKKQLGDVRNQPGQDPQLINAAVRFISQGRAEKLTNFMMRKVHF